MVTMRLRLLAYGGTLNLSLQLTYHESVGFLESGIPWISLCLLVPVWFFFTFEQLTAS